VSSRTSTPSRARWSTASPSIDTTSPPPTRFKSGDSVCAPPSTAPTPRQLRCPCGPRAGRYPRRRERRTLRRRRWFLYLFRHPRRVRLRLRLRPCCRPQCVTRCTCHLRLQRLRARPRCRLHRRPRSLRSKPVRKPPCPRPPNHARPARRLRRQLAGCRPIFRSPRPVPPWWPPEARFPRSSPSRFPCRRPCPRHRSRRHGPAYRRFPAKHPR